MKALKAANFLGCQRLVAIAFLVCTGDLAVDLAVDLAIDLAVDLNRLPRGNTHTQSLTKLTKTRTEVPTTMIGMYGKRV